MYLVDHPRNQSKNKKDPESRVVLGLTGRRRHFGVLYFVQVVRRCSAGETRAARGSRFSQIPLKPQRGRVRATEHAPRDPCRVLERRHGLVEIVERGAVVLIERPGVSPSRPEREIVTLSEDADRRRPRFALGAKLIKNPSELSH